MTKTMSKQDAKFFKKVFISDIMARLLPAYNDIGLTVEDYCENIILPELTNQEFKWLKEMAESVTNV